MPQPRKRHRLALHCGGNPATATVELDGERLTFVSRVEVALDANGQTEARLTVPAALIDIDVDAVAFVTAHAADLYDLRLRWAVGQRYSLTDQQVEDIPEWLLPHMLSGDEDGTDG